MQVRGVLVHAMSGTELSRVRTEFRLPLPEPINKSPLESRRPTLLCNQVVSDYAGGLNGSMQHSSRTRLALKTKAKSLARVRSVGTLPWLGSDRVQPNRSILPRKHCRINALDGVASIG
jgi:hypothetical protein